MASALTPALRLARLSPSRPGALGSRGGLCARCAYDSRGGQRTRLGGLHVGQDDLPAFAARRLLRPEMVLGAGADAVAVISAICATPGPEIARRLLERITAAGAGGASAS